MLAFYYKNIQKSFSHITKPLFLIDMFLRHQAMQASNKVDD